MVREELVPLIQERYPDITINPNTLSKGIWLNGRGLWSATMLKDIKPNRSYTKNGTIIAVYVQDDISQIEMQPYMENSSLVSTELDIQCIENIWDGIFLQPDVIIQDAEYFIELNRGNVHPSVSIENGDNIFIGDSAEVRAGSVLDARSGPIIIAEHSMIDIGALIQGPVYIGPGCVINSGTKLRGNVTLGPLCKIGGEIEDVIFQGYSNKQHDGFLGHSYIGEWVNLGANTNNSNLKNNYGFIRLKIENKITNYSLGKQDHYIAAYGGLRKITYKKKNIDVKKIIISKKNLNYLNQNLLFLWTGKTRLSNKNLTEQKNNFKKNINNLKNLKQVAIKFNNLLNKKKLNLRDLGLLLDQNWKMKQKFTSGISNKYLNRIYKNAISAGCFGGKLLGAGGGGFFIFICKKELQSKVISKIKNCKIVNIKFYNQGTNNFFID